MTRVGRVLEFRGKEGSHFALAGVLRTVAPASKPQRTPMPWAIEHAKQHAPGP